MKIKNIKITNLFGLENNDFDIDVYPNEHITLLYGFNGEGKTTIIKIVTAVLKGDLRTIRTLPFSTIDITFENNSVFCVKKDKDYSKYSIYDYRQKARQTDENIYHPVMIIVKNSHGVIKEHLFRIAGREVFKRMSRIGEFLDKDAENDYCQLYNYIHSEIDIRYIFANKEYNRTEINNDKYTHVRFLKDKIQISYSAEEVRNLINRLEFFLKQEKEEEYILSVNLPDKIDEINNILLEKVKTLDTRYNYNEQKLRDFEERMKIFKEVINEKFQLLNKVVDFDKEKGLFISPKDGITDVGTIEQLSSGEKNIVCLFAEVVLTCESNAVVFIDEPEVSLHVDWQNLIVPTLLEVCEKYDIQVIIMTHSPDIIGEYLGLGNEIVPKRMINDTGNE